ncbi:molybdopterin-binding protein [Methylobacterium sp. NEAU 140]|uniref:molybdopterin-binding protein n=1 Tax=Methylobacterium sp. NEAU 140 TaxID=3064945 RepID=UPI002736E8FB|nr:molybdopterin-binding protein [Methylobacterium sp. NEAU 140]MDP4026515.1 molybdopterin-binding protein [Methylobacterium sp. NEAU 140]
MRFGPVPVGEAAGLISAHTVRSGGETLRKGATIPAEVAARLAAAGVDAIVAAALEPGDVGEDAAAARLAARVAGPNLRAEAPFTGRCNLFAARAGVLVIAREAVDTVNAVDEAVTLATLPPFKPVVAGEMVATVKIIPYAVPGAVLDRACAAGAAAALRVAPYRRARVAVVSTRLPSLKEATIDKTLRALADRLAPTGAAIVAETRVPHAAGAVAEALAGAIDGAGADLAVVFGASAIADRRDVIPAGLMAAGGRVDHLGMPVDPGNLLLLGARGGVPVIGAPGCARSPKENGFDWILHRLLADLPVARADIVALGVGGLLMEIVSRPQPRDGGASAGEDGEGDGGKP